MSERIEVGDLVMIVRVDYGGAHNLVWLIEKAAGKWM